MLLLSQVVQAENEKGLALPPESLAQWYKPANKRQVWLHTMFRLRREMLAISDYTALEDIQRLKKWSDRLAQDYRKIGKMVPEWQDELELKQMATLQKAAEQGDFEQVAKAYRKLGLSCRSCHREYRAIAAALYRTADFSDIQVEDSESLEELPYKKVMERLSLQVNRIKIASEDGRRQTAVNALHNLRQSLGDLGQSCEQCHKDEAPLERILGAEMQKSLAALEQGIESADMKETGHTLGTLAVQVCARCHGVHRTLYDLKKALLE
ncbi:MAG: cytochrome c [Pseudomonadota bacterium]